MNTSIWTSPLFWLACLAQLVAALIHGRAARKCSREWMRLRALNQLVWAYSKELIEKGVSLPPRCVMCCQILPKHVDACLMADEYHKAERFRPRIKYYPKGEHPPHPEEEPPHA